MNARSHAEGAAPRLTRHRPSPLNPGVTPAERTRKSYDVRPYPQGDLQALIRKGGSLPPLKWMQAIGRPGETAPKRVLVAGCGVGVEAFVLRALLPGAEIVAVDFSARSIAEARRLQKTGGKARAIRFLVADLTDPDLARKTGGDFDLITCHGVLSYIPDPARALENFASIIAPGGALYLGVNGEAHPSTRLRPWLASFGLNIAGLKEEGRLRKLLTLWDSLQDDEAGQLAAMSSSYLAGDVCGPHFNNWPLARWNAEAAGGGWEMAATWLLPMALSLAMEEENHRLLFPAGMAGLAERLDQARPAGFHRILLRRTTEQGEASGRRLRWTGLYSVRLKKGADNRTTTAVLSSATFDLRVEGQLKPAQAEALRTLVEAQVSSAEWMRRWGRSEAAGRILRLWAGLGAVVEVEAEA